MAPMRLPQRAKRQDNNPLHDDKPKNSRRSHKRKADPPVPAYERNGIRSFITDRETPANPLPTVSADGEVKRLPRKLQYCAQDYSSRDAARLYCCSKA
eukprot:IDg9041t1